MCERCVEKRNEIRNDLIELLTEAPDSRLMEQVNRFLDESVDEIWKKRIEPALEKHPEMPVPDRRDVRAAVKDCLIGSVCALAAATMASMTPGYTDEGGEPTGLVLGMWAGTVFNREAEIVAEAAVSDLMQHLGMGNN